MGAFETEGALKADSAKRGGAMGDVHGRRTLTNCDCRHEYVYPALICVQGSGDSRPMDTLGGCGLHADEIGDPEAPGVVKTHLNPLPCSQVEEGGAGPVREKARTARHPVLAFGPLRLAQKIHCDAIEHDNGAGLGAARRAECEVNAWGAALGAARRGEAPHQQHGDDCNPTAHGRTTSRMCDWLRRSMRASRSTTADAFLLIPLPVRL